MCYAVVAALEATLLNNLASDGFTLKLEQLRQVPSPAQAGGLLREFRSQATLTFCSLGKSSAAGKVV